MRPCRGTPRGVRATEGAGLGVIVGLTAGSILGGITAAVFGRKAALWIGLGTVFAGVAGSAAVEALPPEC